MLAKRIIACLDVQSGRVVKGRNFQDLKDCGQPPAMAAAYETQGADEIVLLDVSATAEGRLAMRQTLRDTASVLSIPFTVGGGVRSLADAEALFKNGADKVSLNTAAVELPELIGQLAAQFGSQSVVAAIDAKNAGPSWRVLTRAGTSDANRDAVSWARQCEDLGAGELLVSSIDADGTQGGFDLPLLQAVRSATSVPLIASGGAGSMAHYADALQIADAALGAGLFHSGKLAIGPLKAYLKAENLVIRT